MLDRGLDPVLIVLPVVYRKNSSRWRWRVFYFDDFMLRLSLRICRSLGSLEDSSIFLVEFFLAMLKSSLFEKFVELIRWVWKLDFLLAFVGLGC